MIRKSVPVISLNSSAAMCGVPLMPGDAADNVPGLALASAIRSLIVRTGNAGWATSTLADSATWEIAVRSRSVSYGILAKMLGLTETAAGGITSV